MTTRSPCQLPFEAAPYTPYWIQIEALQTGGPDWGLVQAADGDAQHFRRRVVSDATNVFALVPGDPSIELLTSTEPEDAAECRDPGTGRSRPSRCPPPK